MPCTADNASAANSLVYLLIEPFSSGFESCDGEARTTQKASLLPAGGRGVTKT